MSDVVVTINPPAIAPGTVAVVPGSPTSAAVTVMPPSDVVLIEPYTLNYPDTLTTFQGANALYLEGPYTLSSLRFTLGTPSTSGPVILDLRVNEVSIFAGDKPSIAENQSTVLATSLATTKDFVAGDRLTVAIISPGLTQTAGDLTVTLRLKRLF